MSRGFFDAEAFYSALDSQRISKGLSWKKVAEQAGVSASTLTRMAQGKRPDVDTMAALVDWSGLDVDRFIVRAGESPHSADPLAQMTAYLRADKSLSSTSADALEAILKAAYEKLRKD